MISNSQVLRQPSPDESRRAPRTGCTSRAQPDCYPRAQGSTRTALAPARRAVLGRAAQGRGGLATRFPIADAVRALADHDVEGTFDLADRVLAQTGSRLAVIADLLYPAQLELSDLWYSGGVTARQEVEAAGLVRQVIEALPPTPSRNPVARGLRCVLATLPADPHDLGPRMLALAMEDDGWEVEVQSATPPLVEWAGTASRRPTRLLALSVAILPSVAVLTQMIEAAHRHRTEVLVGGVAFARMATLSDKIGADACGADARAGCVLARRLVAR